MTSSKKTFFNARLVDPAREFDQSGALTIENGLITHLAEGEPTAEMCHAAEMIDCEGLVLAPGLVDMRVFVGEPGNEHKETLKSASEAAAAGGVTTIIVMPNTEPVIDDASLVDFIERRARDTAIVNVHPVAALTVGLNGQSMTEMGLLKEAGALAFTQGRGSMIDSQVLRRAMEYASGLDVMIMQQAEDPSLSSGGTMNEGELSARLGLQGIPKEAETIAIERDLALAKMTSCRYHFASLSCPEAVNAIRAAKRDGARVTCSVAAHHLSLNENDIGAYRTFFKTSPPLRSEDDRLALIDALRNGDIDIVTSDHDPQGPESKRLPFAEASFGAVGLESLLPALLELVHTEQLTLIEALGPVTCRPAELLGLNLGRLEIGYPGDLTLIDLNKPFVFEAEELRSKSRNTPFDERKWQGYAVQTFVRGECIFNRND